LIHLENLTNFEIPENEFEKILKSFSEKEVEVIICGNEKIKSINKNFRGKDEPTDVLSFPVLDETGFSPLGSIVISADITNDVSSVLGHSIGKEFQVLFLHGLLHLLGYDHETDNGEMRELEMKYRQKFDLPESLIERI
jgi:probable rRNA maturation factor